jgi:tetratricopeptide (TPR) repeat protein
VDKLLPLRFRRLRPITAAIAFIFLPVAGQAQVATVRESLEVFRTYPFSDPDPVARPGNIYPYFRFQGYSSQPVDRRWKIVTLENEFIRVLVAPELGGKILGAFEKSTGRAFIYFNRVVKFREIAMRGPWTSGGIEFNFGDIGHAPTTATPVDYLTRTNPDGSASCIVGALDLASRTEWRVEIRVPAGKALFETRSSWCNPTETSTSFYHWMNAAAAADSSLELVYPGRAYIGHGGELSPWPGGPGGRDLSRYRENAFGSYKSYHVLGEYTDFFGARWGDFGVIHWSRYADKPGKKLWIWGLSREGEIWTDLLTDPLLGNTQYVEFQSGLHFNQAFGLSSRTPFKHMQFLPGAFERFTESWFPFKGVRGVTRATPEGVLDVRRSDGIVAYSFCPTGEFRGTVSIRFHGGTARARDVSLHPLQCIGDSAISPGLETPFEIRIGSLIRYTSEDDSERVLRRPLAPEQAFDWTSPYGLSVAASEQSRQRDYDGALASYRLSLAKDPSFVPSLSGASELLYRRMDYDSSFVYARRALAIDAYDPRANYMYGLSARNLGRPYDAKDGFGVAAMSREYRSAAEIAMAELAFEAGDWKEAAELGGRVLAEDGSNAGGARLMAALFRRTGDTASALRVLDGMTENDPLSHFARFERYLLSRPTGNERAFTDGVRNELPQETFMEIAAFYGRLGAWDDAGEALRLSPPHPMVDLWRAFAASRLGNKAESESLLARALSASPYLVFPHRREEMEVLLWAERERPHWKTEYYLGLLCMSLGRRAEASRWLQTCGDTPDFAPFYMARASFSKGDTARALADFRRALDVGPEEWRTHNALISCLNERGRYAEALPLCAAAAAKFPGSYILQFLLARTLLFNGKYAAGLSILDTLHILPFEGARYGRDAYRLACIMSALSGMRERGAVVVDSLIERARRWPERLGAGEPYNPDTRVEDFIEAGLRQKSGEAERRKALLTNIAAYTTARRNAGNIQDLIGAFALRALGRTSEALRILGEWKAKDPAGPEPRWALMIFRGEARGARALEESLRPTLLNRSTGDQDFVLVADVVRMNGER